MNKARSLDIMLRQKDYQQVHQSHYNLNAFTYFLTTKNNLYKGYLTARWVVSTCCIVTIF